MIGRTQTCRVFEGRDRRTDAPVAVKVKLLEKQYFNSEVRTLQCTGIPHMVGYRGHVEGMVVMDLAGGIPLNGFLWDKFEKLSEIKSIGRQLLEFLSKFEKIEMIHFDIKPGNLMWESQSRTLTVIDLETACKPGQHDGRMSVQNSAPETILKGEQTSLHDIWSAGCVLFKLIVGTPLFRGSARHDHFEELDLVLGQIVEQLGSPSEAFLTKCKRKNECFDERRKLKKEWNGAPVIPWQERISLALSKMGVLEDEIRQWIALLSSMLCYENRAHAAALLESPIFKDEIQVHLRIDPTKKCIVQICRLSNLENPPDLMIDLKTHINYCLHIPKDPNDKYIVGLIGIIETCSIITLKNGEDLDLSRCQAHIEFIQRRKREEFKSKAIQLLESPSSVRSFDIPPEFILGKTDPKEDPDLWRIGCVLFNLMTGTPLFEFDDYEFVTYEFTVFSKIIDQIGLPSLPYLELCKNASIYFDEPGIPKILNRSNSKWSDVMSKSLKELNIPQSEIDEWVKLISSLLSYENRGNATSHLQRPLFKSQYEGEAETKKSKKEPDQK